MPKKMDNEFASMFESYRELVRRRTQLEDMLRKAEAEKSSVKPDIYERVCREYQSTLDDVSRDLDPLLTKIDDARHRWTTELAEIDTRVGTVEERIEEAKFRHRVGEYSESEYSGLEMPLKKELDDLSETREELKGILNEIEELTERSSPGESGHGDLHPRDGDGHAGNEPPGADRPEDSTEPHGQPAWPSDEADVKTAEPAATKTTGHNSDDLVDLTEWTREFREEHSDRRRRTETATGQPAVATETDDLSDPSANTAPEPPHEEAPAGFPILIITKGPGAGKKLPLVPMTMTLGREHDNNIELKDEDVARYHARISYRSGSYILEDLESSSGTWLNDEKVAQATLRHGDKLRVGATEMIVDFE